MRILFLAFVFGVASSGQIPTPSACIVTPEVKPSDPFQFTMAVLDSMSYARRAAMRPNTLSAGTDAFTQVSDWIYRIKSAALDYGCAAELLRGYQKSKNIYIAVSAMRGVRFYEALINFDGELVALRKKTIGDGPGRLNAGDLAEKLADLRFRKDREGEEFLLIILGVTGTLPSDVPDSNGKTCCLTITTRQKNLIIQKLEKEFGPAISGPEQDGQNIIIGAAAVIYHWISDSGWKTSDSK
jgi:hypothetical protein